MLGSVRAGVEVFSGSFRGPQQGQQQKETPPLVLNRVAGRLWISGANLQQEKSVLERSLYQRYAMRRDQRV